MADIADVSRDIRCLPDEFLVMLTSHLDVEMGPWTNKGPDVMMAGGNMKIDHTGVLQNAQLPTDVCPVMFEDSATEPMSLPVVVNTEKQMFDASPLRWWSPQVYKMAVLRDGSILNLTVVWWMRLYLNRGCLRSTKSEVFSLAVLARGRCCGSPPGSGKDSHSVSVCPAGCWE